MARRPFGGTGDALVTDRDGNVLAGVTGTAWTAQLGGTQLTDLQTPAGVAIPSGLITTDANGRFRFLGTPDDRGELWVDFGAGRALLEATDTDAQLSAAQAVLGATSTQAVGVAGRITALEQARGVAGGIATLGADGKVLPAQLPPMGTGASLLGQLTDVLIGVPKRGQALVYTGTKWAPGWPGPVAQAKAATAPLLVASRGGEDMFPANTLLGAAGAAAGGYAVDATINVTRDGVPVCVPNPVDAYTTLTGSPEAVYFNALAKPIVDAAAWFQPGWGPYQVPALAQFLTEVAGRTITFLECQSALAVTKAIAAAQALHLEDAVVIQSFQRADLAPVKVAGMEALLIHTDGAGLTAASLLADGIGWVGLSMTSTPAATVQTLSGAGIKVLMYTVNRHVDRDLWLSRGAFGFFTNQPQYLNTTPATYRTAADPFNGLTLPVGHLWAQQGAAAGRGTMVAPNWWQQPANTLGFALAGWACPLPSTTYTLKTDIRFDATAAAGGWAALNFGCPTDKAITFTPATDQFYMGLLRPNGQLQLYRVSGGVATAGPAAATPAIGAGGIASIQVQVSPGSLTLTRLGVGAPNSVTWADATFRGPYLHVGGDSSGGNQYSYRAISIT